MKYRGSSASTREKRNSLYEERIAFTEQINKMKIKGAKSEAELSSLKSEVDR